MCEGFVMHDCHVQSLRAVKTETLGSLNFRGKTLESKKVRHLTRIAAINSSAKQSPMILMQDDSNL